MWLSCADSRPVAQTYGREPGSESYLIGPSYSRKDRAYALGVCREVRGLLLCHAVAPVRVARVLAGRFEIVFSPFWARPPTLRFLLSRLSRRAYFFFFFVFRTTFPRHTCRNPCIAFRGTVTGAYPWCLRSSSHSRRRNVQSIRGNSVTNRNHPAWSSLRSLADSLKKNIVAWTYRIR